MTRDNLPYEKVGKNEPVCIADEVPFEIPASWMWVRLKNISNVVSARRVHQSDWKTEGIPFYRAREIGALSESGSISNELFISKELYEEFSKSGVPQAGDLMVTAVGTLGKVYIVKEADRFYYKDASVICLENFGKIIPEYLKIVIHSPYLSEIIKKKSAGTTVDTITIVKANEYLIPIPPISEQIRIVEKLAECNPFIEKYSNKETDLTRLNACFPDLLKKSILQQAVMGKLVQQDPNDEPACVLLERIRAEKQALVKAGKLKKDKHESTIYRRDNSHYEKVNGQEVCIDDEIPFEIPNTWEWVRLGTLMKVISDGTHKTPNYVEDGVPFLSVQNISKGYFDLSRIKYITQEEHEKLIQRVKPERNDILVCRIGTLGKAIKCTVNFDFSIFVSLGLLRPIDYDLSDYVVFAINSPLGDKWIQDNKVGGGTHTYKINLIDLPNMLVPLPPLEEQKRIVESYMTITPIINAL